MTTQLINKHGRTVSVQDHRVTDLLKQGFRRAEQPAAAHAKAIGERSAALREVLEDVSGMDAEATVEATLDSVFAEALANPTKANLEPALVMLGLDPVDFTTNADRLRALKEALKQPEPAE